jgi:hypothetical protein
MKKIIVAASLSFAFSVCSISCSALQDMQRAITNLSQCKFKLDGVADFSLAGISVGGKSGFNMLDGVKLLAAFNKNEFPATFTLNIAAVNPNDGTNNTRVTTATMVGFAWQLMIDNSLTIDGDIASPIAIPGNGQSTIIPLRMNLDLERFFKEKGYEHIINLALALGGANGSPARLTLRAKPTINFILGYD